MFAGDEIQINRTAFFSLIVIFVIASSRKNRNLRMTLTLALGVLQSVFSEEVPRVNRPCSHCPKNTTLGMEEKHHTSQHFYPPIHPNSQRAACEIKDNGHFPSLDALPGGESNVAFIFSDTLARKKMIPETLRCRKWDQPAPFCWQTGPLYLHCTLFPLHTHWEILQTAVPGPQRGRGGGTSWEQNVNSSAADKHAGRSPMLPRTPPRLGHLIYFLLALNKRYLYICQVNKKLF